MQRDDKYNRVELICTSTQIHRTNALTHALFSHAFGNIYHIPYTQGTNDSMLYSIQTGGIYQYTINSTGASVVTAPPFCANMVVVVMVESMRQIVSYTHAQMLYCAYLAINQSLDMFFLHDRMFRVEVRVSR